MTALPLTTQHRLRKIPQTPSVWEGDRRPTSGEAQNLDTDAPSDGDCILWVDGTEGMVRAMDVVSPEMGSEAIVRTLLRAIENPHSQATPARPQKVIVRDREIQFFLRGALQNLEIEVDYAPNLPLIEEVFRGFEEVSNTRPPTLPPQYSNLLEKTAYEVWNEAPWECLADHDILSIEISKLEVGTLYASAMGMLGEEYGVLLYRSIESLKQFREAAVTDNSIEKLENAFLQQDCWFLSFEQAEHSEQEDEVNLATLPSSAIHPNFGSVHPYEGIRPFLGEEEAITVYVALKALQRFLRQSKRDLEAETLSSIVKHHRISLPEADGFPKTVAVTVSTMPDLATELSEMLEQAESTASESGEPTPETSLPLREDLIPEDSLLSLGMVPWEWVEVLSESNDKYYQSQGASPSGDEMPVVLIQTSRPKAQALIENLQAAGNLKGICFNPGEDPFSESSYDLGILQTGNEDLYLFGEFSGDAPAHLQARQQWDRRCQQTNGYCGLIIARGLKGASRGQPKLRDIMALFEAEALSAEALGMGMLQLMPQPEF
ncbi:MAG: hypothetical protein BRC40_02725 [Cyanobacteria bacterium QH_8_48_120]|nr:MAG: hypothetical protein BRC35_07385 [Cyanobacteria bacterium QH_10_48_56]PSO68948.1 MAG: hypothetical protein BRC38_00835 [Cyanobacteria bacterium QH_6_48_35]PSO69590.1 MAG: hypothetical protein BRC37_17350 [Cyanobacteria bacterium QH_3_48_40]PSO76789.1 MAG: hypothetical protein BRC40_02725 [Cyanobacteria bacterium QH_8_48_120]